MVMDFDAAMQDEPVAKNRFDGELNPPAETPDSNIIKLPSILPDARIRESVLKDIEPLKKWPFVYGLAGAMKGTEEYIVDTIPWMKYRHVEEREEFGKLSTQEQTRALLLETLFGVVGTPAGSAVVGKAIVAPFKFAGKLVGKVVDVGSRLVRGPKPIVTAVEDLNVWTKSSYEAALDKELGRLGIDRVGEKQAVKGFLRGDVQALKEPWLSVERVPSEALRKISGFQPGVPYVRPVLNEEVAARLQPEALRRAGLISGFEKSVKRTMVGMGEKSVKGRLDEGTVNAALRIQAERFFDREVASRITLESATDDMFDSFTQDLLKGGEAKRLMVSQMRPSSVAMFRPVQSVMSRGEEMFGTATKIYKVVKDGLRNARLYQLGKVELLQDMLAQRGLMQEAGEKAGIKQFKPTNLLTPELRDAGFKVLQTMDDMFGKARSAGVRSDELNILRGELDNVIESVVGPKAPKENVRMFVETVHTWMDKLYSERAAWKISNLFEKAGLTADGQIKLDAMVNEEVLPELERIFSSQQSLNYVDKVSGLKNMLTKVRSRMYQGLEESPTGWFNETAADKLKKLVGGLDRELKLPADSGKFLDYLESYMPRVSDVAQGVGERAFNALAGRHSAFYTHGRIRATALDSNLGFDELVLARSNAQAREMFFYDKLESAVAHAKTLPQGWRNYTEHYVARLLNLPSRWDAGVASLLQNTVGVVQSRLGKEGVWDAHRVMNLSKDINDFTYMGFLGFKPATALRNLFQPLVTVPADLGSVNDIWTLSKAYSRMLGETGKATRDYLNDLGVIQEFLPESQFNTSVLNLGSSKKFLGMHLPSKDRVRDMAMWMIQTGDHLNRYVTGAAALEKWETALSKFTVGEGLAPEARLIKPIMRKTGAGLRKEFVASDIEALIKRGHFEEAKKIFVKDVVDSTQFLYGSADSPMLAQAFGAPGRLAMTFQTWWANYGDLLHQWATRGKYPGDKAATAISFVLSNAIAASVMYGIWDGKVAATNTFLGPLPDPNAGIMLPPAYDAALKLIQNAAGAGDWLKGAIGDDKALAAAQRRALAMLKSGVSFTPGGVQVLQIATGASREGIPGAIKSILGVKVKKPKL